MSQYCPSHSLCKSCPLILALLAMPIIGVRADPPSPDALGPNDSDGYLRVRERENGILSLQVLTRTFVPASGNGPRIHLAGAIHIGDESYYKRMQSRLDANDLVLFEGVRPPGSGRHAESLDDAGRARATRNRMRFLQTAIAQFRERETRLPANLDDLATSAHTRFRDILPGLKRDAWDRPIVFELVDVPGDDDKAAPRKLVRLISHGSDGSPGGDGLAADITVDSRPMREQGEVKAAGRAPNVQAQMARALGLAFQLEVMNSGKPNWRSSDMDMDELQTRLEKAGGDAAIILKMLDGDSLFSKIAGFVLGLVASSPTTAATLKMVMIEVLANSEPMLAGGGKGRMPGMPAGMEKAMAIILTDRNVVVMNDLKAILANEKTHRDIAIFYGAGHMRDLERRLIHELNYIPERDLWTTAIRADPRDTGMPAEQIKSMRKLMRRMIERRMKS